jgi:hypothetical protein
MLVKIVLGCIQCSEVPFANKLSAEFSGFHMVNNCKKVLELKTNII